MTPATPQKLFGGAVQSGAVNAATNRTVQTVAVAVVRRALRGPLIKLGAGATAGATLGMLLAHRRAARLERKVDEIAEKV